MLQAALNEDIEKNEQVDPVLIDTLDRDILQVCLQEIRAIPNVWQKLSGDELYQKALHAVVTEQRATVGWLQGVLAVTEEQAGVLLDLLEDQGVVGPANDLGGRSVLWATE